MGGRKIFISKKVSWHFVKSVPSKYENCGDTMKIIFGLLSCRESSAAVTQFANVVWPHIVLVHHDFKQCATFNATGENIFLVEKNIMTSWGQWSLVEVALVLLQDALTNFDFDYFQLVSESCLPIRPIVDFVSYLEKHRPEVMINRLPLSGYDAVNNYGWRYLVKHIFTRKIMRRAGLMCFGDEKIWRESNGINMQVAGRNPEKRKEILKKSLGRFITKILLASPSSAFPIGSIEQCWVGSQWFGTSRNAALRIVHAVEEFPLLQEFYRSCPIPDESYFHTLIGAIIQTGISAGNHLTIWRLAGFGPDQLTFADLATIRSSKLFFARKFTLDPSCPVRVAVIRSTSAY